MGGFRVIFPCKDEQRTQHYHQLMVKAQNALDAKPVVRKASLLSQDKKDKRKDSMLSQGLDTRARRKDPMLSPDRVMRKDFVNIKVCAEKDK